MILSRLQLACGDLGDDLVVGIAKLALQIDVPIPVQRHHRRPAGVVDKLPDGRVPIDQPNLIQVDLQQPSVKDLTAGQRFFAQLHAQYLPACPMFFHILNSLPQQGKNRKSKVRFSREKEGLPFGRGYFIISPSR